MSIDGSIHVGITVERKISTNFLQLHGGGSLDGLATHASLKSRLPTSSIEASKSYTLDSLDTMTEMGSPSCVSQYHFVMETISDLVKCLWNYAFLRHGIVSELRHLLQAEVRQTVTLNQHQK